MRRLVSLIGLAFAPAVAFAQDVIDPFDPTDIVNQLPIAAKWKTVIVAGLAVAYLALVIARRFAPPDSTVGRFVRAVLVGWKHPDERPAPTPPAPPQGGFVSLRLMIALAAVVALAVVAPARVRAEEPKFGGCLDGGHTCFAPSVSVNVLAVSLKSGDLTSTFDPGIGYGVTLFADRWYRTGFSATLSFPQFDGRKRIAPAAIFSFAEYARVGLACPLWVRGGFAENAQALIGFGSDFGTAK